MNLSKAAKIWIDCHERFDAFKKYFNERNIEHHSRRESRCHREEAVIGSLSCESYNAADPCSQPCEHCQT